MAKSDDVATRSVQMFLLIFAIALAASLGGTKLYFDALEGRAEHRDARPLPIVAEAGPRMVPAPHLQVTPPAEMRALAAAEEARLGSYGWVDRATGRVRIPIERAIELTAERGLPARREPR